MTDPALAPLAHWQNFYVIIGAAAGALTGLQFVVMALVGDMGQRSSTAEIDAFATPTIVHFVVSLWLSAALSAPWNGLTSVAVLLGLTGIVGIGYAIVVTRRAHKQTGYKPVFEDWLWHAALPVVGYGALFCASLALGSYEVIALFVVGAVALLLLFIGIHNAWDTVTWLTVKRTASLPATTATDAYPAKSEPPD
jgi:hypothetical protein